MCNEFAKLHGLEFQGRKIIIEEAKTPPRTLSNELSTSAVANDQQNMHKMPSAINDVRSKSPTAPTEEQSPIQNINSTYSNAGTGQKLKFSIKDLFSKCKTSFCAVSCTKEEKHCTFFGQYTSRDENETSKFPGEGRKNTLKAFPGAKANQLNHYVVQRKRNSIMIVL